MDETLRAERRRCHRLYLIGTTVAIAGMVMGTMPPFAARTPLVVSKGCAAAGALIRMLGRFAPDRFLRRWLASGDS